MPCHAMHPMQDLFLESFSYELQLDMHSYLHKKIYSCKKWVLQAGGVLGVGCRAIGHAEFCHSSLRPGVGGTCRDVLSDSVTVLNHRAD
jgi:hypothetical protein